MPAGKLSCKPILLKLAIIDTETVCPARSTVVFGAKVIDGLALSSALTSAYGMEPLAADTVVIPIAEIARKVDSDADSIWSFAATCKVMPVLTEVMPWRSVLELQ